MKTPPKPAPDAHLQTRTKRDPSKSAPVDPKLHGRAALLASLQEEGLTIGEVAKRAKELWMALEAAEYHYMGSTVRGEKRIPLKLRAQLLVDLARLMGLEPGAKVEVTGADGGPILTGRLTVAERVAFQAQADAAARALLAVPDTDTGADTGTDEGE